MIKRGHLDRHSPCSRLRLPPERQSRRFLRSRHSEVHSAPKQARFRPGLLFPTARIAQARRSGARATSRHVRNLDRVSCVDRSLRFIPPCSTPPTRPNRITSTATISRHARCPALSRCHGRRALGLIEEWAKVPTGPPGADYALSAAHRKARVGLWQWPSSTPSRRPSDSEAVIEPCPSGHSERTGAATCSQARSTFTILVAAPPMHSPCVNGGPEVTSQPASRTTHATRQLGRQ